MKGVARLLGFMALIQVTVAIQYKVERIRIDDPYLRALLKNHTNLTPQLQEKLVEYLELREELEIVRTIILTSVPPCELHFHWEHYLLQNLSSAMTIMVCVILGEFVLKRKYGDVIDEQFCLFFNTHIANLEPQEDYDENSESETEAEDDTESETESEDDTDSEYEYDSGFSNGSDYEEEDETSMYLTVFDDEDSGTEN